MSLELLNSLGTKVAAAQPAQPGMAPNSFQLQRYGQGATVPMRAAPLGFDAPSLAQQLPVDYNKPAPAPAPAPQAAPITQGMLDEMWKALDERYAQPRKEYYNDGH